MNLIIALFHLPVASVKFIWSLFQLAIELIHIGYHLGRLVIVAVRATIRFIRRLSRHA